MAKILSFVMSLYLLSAIFLIFSVQMFNLENKNIVIVATQFNPSVFNSIWFVTNDILKVEEILPASIFSQDIAQIVTADFIMIVVLNQLVFTVQGENEDKALGVLSRCVELLPHVPYSAIGINFNYNSDAYDEQKNNVSRRLFFIEGNPIHKMFDVENARFGAYLSKDYEGSRLKLDIKPVNVLNPVGGKIEKKIRSAFNFHNDFQEQKIVPGIVEFISKWRKFKDYSEEVMKSAFN